MNEDDNILPDEFMNAFNEDGAGDNLGVSEPGQEAALAAVEGAETPDEGDKTDALPTEAVEQKDAPESNSEAAVAAPVAEEEDDEAGMSAKEIQRKRTFEGRMRKLEDDLKAVASQKKAAAGEVDPGADPTDGLDAKSGGDKSSAAEVIEQLQDGSISADEATKQLTEDFGEEFVKMIAALVDKKATEIAGKTVADGFRKVSDEVKEINSQIADKEERRHFEAITDAFPDFYAQVKSPEFSAFVQAGDDKVQQAAKAGSAKDVIALMKKFTAASVKTVAAPEVEDPALSAAAGVRSGAMRLPETPGSSHKDDFEGAWAEASKG